MTASEVISLFREDSFTNPWFNDDPGGEKVYVGNVVKAYKSLEEYLNISTSKPIQELVEEGVKAWDDAFFRHRIIRLIDYIGRTKDPFNVDGRNELGVNTCKIIVSLPEWKNFTFLICNQVPTTNISIDDDSYTQSEKLFADMLNHPLCNHIARPNQYDLAYVIHLSGYKGDKNVGYLHRYLFEQLVRVCFDIISSVKDKEAESVMTAYDKYCKEQYTYTF